MTERAARSAASVERVQSVLQLFEAKAPTWQAKYAPGGRLADRVTRMAGAVGRHARPGGIVLDLGCGTGELALGLAAAGFRVTGADISPQMLGRARAADRRAAVEWVQLDPGWRALAVAPGAFDAVVAASVLEYVDDPAAVLGACARVLRPGGTLLLTVPDLRHPVRWAEWAASRTARLPLPRAGLGLVPGLPGYLAYLGTSRQRHRLRWWHAAARRAGLSAVPGLPGGDGRPAPLRVLAFRRGATA